MSNLPPAPSTKLPELFIKGIPESVAERASAVCRSRLLTAVQELLRQTSLSKIAITIETATASASADVATPRSSSPKSGRDDELTIHERAQRYQSQMPLHTFEHLVLPQAVIDDLLAAVELIRLETKVFDEWGLRQIEPFPRTALSLYGPPGSGKTLAAHALANKLQRPILAASYAEIESKFHGDGPKNVQAIFHAAERDKAVLFIDEAESLLSKRLVEVTQASEQAINSMRSQLLICLQQFRGVVIFATNLVQSYDVGFMTRVSHVFFPLPDEKCCREIWRRHLVERLPLAPDVCLDALAAAFANTICGRDIKNAVIDAAVRAARQGKEHVQLDDLLQAVQRIRTAQGAIAPRGRELTAIEAAEIGEKVQSKLAKKNERNGDSAGELPV